MYNIIKMNTSIYEAYQICQLFFNESCQTVPVLHGYINVYVQHQYKEQMDNLSKLHVTYKVDC
jgi:hypothetical protein